MSVTVMRRKFDVVPATTDIMQLLFGADSGDRDKAKDALQAFLTPVKDLLDLLYLVDQMKNTAQRHVELLKEQEGLIAEIANIKTQRDSSKADFDKSTKALNVLAAQVADLEKQRDKISKEIEDEQTAKLRVNKAVSAEYDKLRAAMLAKVADEEGEARKTLEDITGQVEAAQKELDALAEKKRNFIASLGA